MGSLADLLSQSRPDVHTRKALLVLDLQNDFSQGGKLPVNYSPGLGSLGSLCNAFRSNHDPVVWLRTEFAQLQLFDELQSTAGGDAVIVSTNAGPDESATQSNGDEGDDSEEEFLRNAIQNSPRGKLFKRVAERTKAASKPAPEDLFLSSLHPTPMLQCCQTTTFGADFTQSASRNIDSTNDFVLVKHTYSAFSSTDLLLHLRSRLVTQLFICGTLTNASVYATAASAVQHGMRVSIIEDCLGYVDRVAHDEALKQMKEIMGAGITTCAAVIRPTLKKKRSSLLPRISVRDQADSLSTNESPSSAPRTKTKLPQRSPEGSRFPGAARSESQSPMHSSPSSRIPLVRSESKGSIKSDVSRRTSSLALRQKSLMDLSADTSPNSLFGQELEAETSVSPDARLVEGSADQHSQVESAEGDFQGQDHRNGEPDMTPVEKIQLRCPHNSVSVTNGDSLLIEGALKDVLNEHAFSQLKGEVYWQRMFHSTGQVPRLVCAQGIIDPETGAMPIYRHPADEALPLLHYSPLVDRIRHHVEHIIGHPLNHCLAQLYRGGHDFISEHSDKTLDVIRGSWIVNVSLGAQRTMRLRSKKQRATADVETDQPNERLEQPPARESHLVPLPHASIFLLGPQDNMTYLHGIQANKRPENQKSELEQAYNGERISLTFRYIGTFLDADSRHIWGQGASAKLRQNAAKVVNGDEQATASMIKAFGIENQTGIDFDWQSIYGRGFDVLHFHAEQESVPILFRTSQHDVAVPIETFFQQHNMPYTAISSPPSVSLTSTSEPDICLRDVDMAKTQVTGLQSILIYLDRFYGNENGSRIPNISSYKLVLDLAEMAALPAKMLLDLLENLLRRQRDANDFASNEPSFLAGKHFSIADCAYWTLIDDAVDLYALDCKHEWPMVFEYHQMLTNKRGMSTRWHDAEENI